MSRDVVFASYLGPNTLEPAEALADAVEAVLGVPVHHVINPPDARADIMWACGLMTAERIEAGALHADIVAAPVFPGEAGPTYRSVIVTRRDAAPAAASSLFAINQPDSWSGHHALRVHIDKPFRTVVTGSHVASLQAVQGGAADAAAIDSSVWGYLTGVDPELERELVVVDRTIDWPSPPFAVARRLDANVRAAIRATLLSATVPGLTAVVPATTADYDPMRRAARRGARSAGSDNPTDPFVRANQASGMPNSQVSDGIE